MDVSPEENEQMEAKLSPESEKAHFWKSEYERALDEVVKDSEHVSFEEIIEVAFQKGVVDRLAPLDEEIKRLRIEQHHRVWKGSRDDADLYAQLYFAVECSKASQQYTSDLSWTNAANAAYKRMMGSDVLRERFFGGDIEIENSWKKFSEALQERIEREYREKGGTLHLEMIPLGTEAAFHGIELIVKGYNPDGTLEVEAKTEKGHVDLYTYNKGKITPEMFLSKDFVIEK